MGLGEADTRAKLIDPAIHARGWTEDLIRREETAGAVEIVDGKPRKQAKGRVDYVLRVKVNRETQPVAVALIEATAYLRWSWDIEEIRQDIERRSRTSAGIYKINQANLADVLIPVPPIDEQDRIVVTLAEKMTATGRTRRALQEQLAEVDALPAALLRRAFSGEL